MGVPKRLGPESKIYPDVTNGTYEIAYRKDAGAWIIMTELETIIPTNRKADLKITLSGKEVDV